jgi:Tfp pilus assembly protein FimT
MAVIAIMGVMASIAAPRMREFMVRTRVRSAMLTLRADLAHARMLAVRSGHGAVVRFFTDPACAEVGPRSGRGYRIAARGVGAPARLATLRMLEGGACFAVGGGDSLVFNSRGLLAPFNNRTIWAVEDGVRDSLTISVAGRVLHREP